MAGRRCIAYTAFFTGDRAVVRMSWLIHIRFSALVAGDGGIVLAVVLFIIGVAFAAIRAGDTIMRVIRILHQLLAASAGIGGCGAGMPGIGTEGLPAEDTSPSGCRGC